MQSSPKAWLPLFAFALLSVVSGCEADLPKVTLIEHMRVLGAHQAVVGDEKRAIPKPGETARMTWAMAYPEVETQDDELSSFFIDCTAPLRYTGTPVCQEFIDAAQGRTTGLGFGFSQPPMGCDVKPDSTQSIAGIRLVCVTGTPTIDVPIAKSVRTPRLVQGIICRNGIPRLDLESPTGASCKPKGKGADFEEITVYGTVNIETKPEEANENPDIGLAKLSIRIEATSNPIAWNAAAPAALPALERDCTTADIVQATEGHEKVILIDYPKQTASNERKEDIVFSTYATFGKLSRRFTVFESSGEQVDAPDLTWDLSEEERTELVGKPKLVRFYFTVVDGRGGFDITTRELCVNRK